jgi:hypothetical protein
VQESAFARAGRRDDGNHLALPQTEIRIGQNREALLAAAVNLLQTPRFHHDWVYASRTRRSCRDCVARVILQLGHFCS